VGFDLRGRPKPIRASSGMMARGTGWCEWEVGFGVGKEEEKEVWKGFGVGGQSRREFEKVDWKGFGVGGQSRRE